MPTGGALLAMFAAGALAASVNAVAGGGSLVTFPVLVALAVIAWVVSTGLVAWS
mgnify:CR=1 FL=1